MGQWSALSLEASHKAQMLHNAKVQQIETKAVIADELWSEVQKNNSTAFLMR